MDKFRDYIWYLLSKPFKILKKAQNQWWIWAKVMGGWWDEVKDDLQRARDETTIATCSDIMLQIHAEDRGPNGITQYVGESNDAFRSRIAMYDETERLGGTRDGIILAVNSIGYEDVEHVWLPRYNGDWDRWAEFIIIINEDVANPQPTSTANLIREVRDKKESTSKDNYLIRYYADVWNKLISEMDTTYLLRSHFYKQRYLDGSRKLDGSRTLSGAIGRIEGDTGYLLDVQNKIIEATEQELENVMDVQMNVLPETSSAARMTVKFWYGRRLDGTRNLDGSRTLSTLTGRIEARKDYLFDVYTVAQGSGSIG